MLQEDKANETQESKKTMPIRISQPYYEWLRMEAFETNNSIKNITDHILKESMQHHKREYHNEWK